jgi:alpha-glucosidase
LAFLREHAGERLLCVFNMSENPVSYTMPVATRASDAPGIDAEPEGGKLNLAPFGAYIGLA